MPVPRPSRALALLLAAALAGCGIFDDEDRAPWRAQAEAACFSRGLVKLSPLIRKADEVDGKGACGLDRPLKVAALADGQVRIGGRELLMSCPVTAALEGWVRDVVQPAALAVYGMPVTELKSMGTYNCRSRNNRRGARLSEHAFANAIDVSGFVLADGRTVTVKKDWRGAEADRTFLRAAHAGACGPFSTVLGPGSDGQHEDHIHLDLARHDAKGTYRYCKPRLEMPPLPQVSPMLVAGARTGGLVVSDAPPPGTPAPWPRVLPPAAAPGPTSIEDLIGAAPSVPACPPGYVCAPAAPAFEPPPVGWQVGPQPATVYDGSIPLGYHDD